jgi:hypothetical protein
MKTIASPKRKGTIAARYPLPGASKPGSEYLRLKGRQSATAPSWPPDHTRQCQYWRRQKSPVRTYLPPLLMMTFSFLAVVYSSFETARHPSQGGCWAFAEEVPKLAASPVVTRAAASDPLRLRMAVIVRAKCVGQELSHVQVQPPVPRCP